MEPLLLPPFDVVSSLLGYNPETGIFTWKENRSRLAKKGDRAGSIDHAGYRKIRVCGVLYPANRLAWLLMTGEDPCALVDHKNLVRDDDRWENLRLATSAQNNANTKIYRNNKSGYKGVSWSKRLNKWISQISINKTSTHLGCFNDPTEAAKAYEVKAKEVFGEFARLK